jgi:hypothetical protein
MFWVQAHVITAMQDFGYMMLHKTGVRAEHIYAVLDFKLLPCSECRMRSSGLFTSVCSLNSNVSEHTVCSIFIDE